MAGAATMAGLVDFECQPAEDGQGLYFRWNEGGRWLLAEIRDLLVDIDENLLVVREVMNS